jgi:hypothetical protein
LEDLDFPWYHANSCIHDLKENVQIELLEEHALKLEEEFCDAIGEIV